MTGATIVIDDASAADTMRSVKERVFAANYRLPVRRQRLMYRPGPRGIEPLADDDTLGGAGVAQDGTAVIDMLLADLTAAEQTELDQKVIVLTSQKRQDANLTMHTFDMLRLVYLFCGAPVVSGCTTGSCGRLSCADQ